MSNSRPGITLRIALLTWLITTVILVVCVVIIVPEQKRGYLENLESKARVISASLQDVLASAAVNEDYSGVVDHCKQVMQGDLSVKLLVITRNDGFSLIHQSVAAPVSRAGATAPAEVQWYAKNMDSYWHPSRRLSRSSIARLPEYNERLYYSDEPFDYSGIEWGWIHVGLSLESYDRSVARGYLRTGILAVVCLMFSFGTSILYARRLVRPLHDLNDAVGRVAAGDLNARAEIRSNDEIQDLAQSFNTMTQSLLQRDRILESVRVAAQLFLSGSNWHHVINAVLAKIGQASGVSRIRVFENHTAADGVLRASQRYEWVAPGILPQTNTNEGRTIPWHGAGFDAMARRLQRGEMVVAEVLQLAPAERALLGPPDIRSTILVPITIEGIWWGCLELDECTRERRWTDAEQDSFRTAAEMLGSAIARHRAQEELLEARNTLEDRVQERTRALQEQMQAKEKANEQLAEAQQRLMQASRLAGMADVATGVLHNVGNVLNSINVSSTLVRERLRNSEVESLARLGDLLRQHEPDLPAFLATDPKGGLIPRFIIQLAGQLRTEHSQLTREHEQLARNVEHMKKIVAMQQNYARVFDLRESVTIASLVEDALQINASDLLREHVRIVRQYAEVPPVMTDKHKVLQILVNLVSNAKHALTESGRADKELVVRIAESGNSTITVAISDNGIGIPRENLDRIFAHGFSTRTGGHGFGLHSGANAAKEIGGHLRVQSDGPGRGATFTLELPSQENDASPTPATP